MLVELLDKLRSSSIFLSEEIFIKHSILPAKLIRSIFVVISNEVAEDSRGHILVIRSWSHSWVKHRSHITVAFSSD